MIRFPKRNYIFLPLNKSPIMSSSRIYKAVLQRGNDSLQRGKHSFQYDKAMIDRVIEENDGVYDRIKENRSLDDYYRYNCTVKMLRKENEELRRKNELLNEERDDLINKNNELKEFLKDKYH